MHFYILQKLIFPTHVYTLLAEVSMQAANLLIRNNYQFSVLSKDTWLRLGIEPLTSATEPYLSHMRNA